MCLKKCGGCWVLQRGGKREREKRSPGHSLPVSASLAGKCWGPRAVRLCMPAAGCLCGGPGKPCAWVAALLPKASITLQHWGCATGLVQNCLRMEGKAIGTVLVRKHQWVFGGWVERSFAVLGVALRLSWCISSPALWCYGRAGPALRAGGWDKNWKKQETGTAILAKSALEPRQSPPEHSAQREFHWVDEELACVPQRWWSESLGRSQKSLCISRDFVLILWWQA